jgi:hypothetical protein
MIKTIKKLNIFKRGPAPYEAKGFRSGFVILFAVTLSAILLAIALGVANIAFKEAKFGTSAKDTNNAFLAADTGAESALFNNKSSNNLYVPSPGTDQIWNFPVSGLGSGSLSCATVSVEKNNTNPPSMLTTIISKGYNIGDATCSSSNPDRIERELKITYGSSTPLPPMPTLIASPSTINPGDTITVTFNNIPSPTPLDWIGLYTTLADNSSYINWVYNDGSPNCTQTSNGGAISSGSCTFIMPSTPGNYNFRLFANDGYILIATSNTVSVSVNTYTVTGVAGANGSISPASQSVNSGSTATLTVTPIPGYTASASGCGGSLVGNTYTTGPITAACTVTASFTAIPPTPHIYATAGTFTWTAPAGVTTVKVECWGADRN